MRYTYFPGCSLEATAVPYQISISAISGILGLEFEELKDWNCCGATPYMSIKEMIAFAISAKNLALAERQGGDLVAPCSACFTILNKTNVYLKEFPKLKERIDIALNEVGLKYNGGVIIRHLLDVFVRDVGYDQLATKVKVRLEGLKVAPYYGCQIVRPEQMFDNAEMPTSLDTLILTLGAQPIHFPIKSQCCGGTLSVTKEKLGLRMIKDILLCAAQNNADCIVTTCPLCQINLDVYQKKVNKRYRQNFSIPILYFTQLMGLAMGIPVKKLAIKKTITPVKPVLGRYYI